MKGTVEGLSGRRSSPFLSATHQDPDLSAELFLLEALGTNDPRPSGGG
jgi:hypothetical protein